MPSKKPPTNNQLAKQAEKHAQAIEKRESKAAAEYPPSIDDLIVIDPGWTGSIQYVAWLNRCTVDEWRVRYKAKHG